MLKFLRTPLMIAALIAGTFVGVVAPASSASAGPPACPPPSVNEYLGNGAYSACHPPAGGNDPETPPAEGGGNGTPTCNLNMSGGSLPGKADRGPNFCIDTDTCFNTGQVVPMAPPVGEPPNEDSEARMTWCYTMFGTLENVRTFWSDDEEPPTRLQQAQEAIGNIDLGTPALATSPTGRTLVNLDTWFWMDGARDNVTGSSAFGLVAIATFRSMSVNPGDTSGSFGCPLVTSADEAEESCFHEYRRASNRGSATVGGRPAYQASVTAVYDLRFEVNGTSVSVPGAPATLDAAPADAAVRVDEVQSRVTAIG